MASRVDKARIKVLIAKVGLDGHDVGAKIVAKALADAGMEVVYTGRRQSSEAVVKAAVQEDVDLIGVSILSGAHMNFFPEILRLLKENGAQEIPVFGGGIIPAEDIKALKALGVKELFPPGTALKRIVETVQSLAGPPKI